jgi:teichuronic acid biosynthesis glycosyltransferase TuaG
VKKVNKILKEETVSVIIPVYNSEEFINSTLDSVLNQTYKNIEVVIVDDCSTDNTEDIINEYLLKNRNIIYYKLENNSGAAIARNKAIELANGRYIAFIDSDDIWYPRKIEKQLEFMKEKNAAICYTAIEMIDEEDRILKGKRDVLNQVDYKFLLKNTMIATSSVVIDREVTGNFRMPLLRSGQDYATWLLLLRNGTIAFGINEALVKYRKRSNSLSSGRVKNIKKVFNIQRKYENINPIIAAYNSAFYALNAFKKHILK